MPWETTHIISRAPDTLIPSIPPVSHKRSWTILGINISESYCFSPPVFPFGLCFMVLFQDSAEFMDVKESEL